MNWQGELQLMQRDNAASCPPFVVEGPVWPRLNGLFNEWMTMRGIGDVEAQQFNSCFSSYHRNDRRYKAYAELLGATDATLANGYQRANELFLRHLVTKDVHRVLERTKPSQSEMIVVVDGRPVSWDYLLSVNEVMSVVEAVPTALDERLVVIDLGSGWGRLGHVLLQLNPLLTYVACDLPEPLAIAQEYLPRHIDCNVHRYSEVRGSTLDRTTLTPGAWFCGTHDLDRMVDGCADVVLNVSSFQELTMAQVTAYFDVIDRVAKGGTFYTRQRNLGDVMTRETYPYLPTWKRVFERPTLTPPNFFEAAFRVV